MDKHIATLEKVYSRIKEGDFYDDYDDATKLLGEFREAIAAIALMRGQSEDVAAARRERDEAIEEKEFAELELAYLANEMVYDGNSIGWIASKAKNYGAAILRAWDALTEVGGKCDGQTTLADAIRQHFAATKPKDPADEQ